MTLLVATPLSPPSYQVGLGASYSSAGPADLYVLASGSTTTVTPLTSKLILNSTGTLTAVTVQLPSLVAEGTVIRLWSNQTVTTLTLTAGTNQTGVADTIVGGIAAMTASTAYEFTYRLAQATNTSGQIQTSTNLYTWYRTQ